MWNPKEYVAEVYAGVWAKVVCDDDVIALFNDSRRRAAMTNAPQCFQCTNLERSDSFNPFRCRALPDMIPVPIQMNRHDHRKPYPGDRGFHFDSIEVGKVATTSTTGESRETRRGRGRVAR